MFKNIADVDACSLYPSAMYKMDGCLEGKPKVLRNPSYEFLKQQDGYLLLELELLNWISI